MAEVLNPGCARPAGGPVSQFDRTDNTLEEVRKEQSSMILIGRTAPDFTAPGYHRGKFVNVKLSEYLGKWVLLCFYPGDFTFV
jgi:hypothetical protein